MSSKQDNTYVSSFDEIDEEEKDASLKELEAMFAPGGEYADVTEEINVDAEWLQLYGGGM